MSTLKFKPGDSPERDAPFSRAQRLVHAEAPGRINLIGEHTDYNGGYVLPLAIPLTVRAAGVIRNDHQVYVSSRNAGDGPDQARYRIGEESPTGSWIDYVQGVTRVLQEEGFKLSGFELSLSSTIPLGGGLSSSAALEVAVLRALNELFHLRLDDVGLALVAHRAETDFVGAKVGLMDQMAASLGDARGALFLETRTLNYERIPLPPGAAWIVIDSGIKHAHAGGEYNLRRRECAEAARLLEVKFLSDLDESDLGRVEKLPDPYRRRARHVITENRRVLDAVRAMRGAKLPRLGKLFYASHDSMRDDYEVSLPEIDFLVESLRAEKGVYGARLTGGGFGGCVIALARPGEGLEAARKAVSGYGKRFEKTAEVLLSFLS